MSTREFKLIFDYVGMVQFLHDVDFLVDVLLQEGFPLDMALIDDFDGVVEIIGFFISQ